jgi:hypothetical protein
MGFYHSDWGIDGDDLVAIVVSAIPKSPGDPPDAGSDAVLFLRVPRFRDRTPADSPLWGPPLPK